MQIAYKRFRKEDIDQLYEAFVKAFGEYYVNFNPSTSQFRERIFRKLNIDPEVSGMVWEEDRVIGFILHTINEYNGRQTAYNGGTGVVPERRNMKLMSTLYEKLIPEIREQMVKSILLEVVTKNEGAINLYRSLGFQFTRTFQCFKSYETYRPSHRYRIETSPAIKEDYQQFWDYQPSFLDNSNQLSYNLQLEFVLEAYSSDQLLGYIIFQPKMGRISQMAVSKEHRGQGVGHELLAYAQSKSIIKTLTIMNVPEDEEDTINSLKRLGFHNEVDQYEMELIL